MQHGGEGGSVVDDQWHGLFVVDPQTKGNPVMAPTSFGGRPLLAADEP